MSSATQTHSSTKRRRRNTLTPVQVGNQDVVILRQSIEKFINSTQRFVVVVSYCVSLLF
jgi:hypothetical protein